LQSRPFRLPDSGGEGAASNPLRGMLGSREGQRVTSQLQQEGGSDGTRSAAGAEALAHRPFVPSAQEGRAGAGEKAPTPGVWAAPMRGQPYTFRSSVASAGWGSD